MDEVKIDTKATLIAARMTRIKRIYADFDPACGVIGTRLATKALSHKATKEPFLVQPTLCLRGRKTFAAGKRKSA